MLTRLDLSERSFANGRLFGNAGAYHELRGTAFFGLDPQLAANQSIVDLDLAPRDAAGQVLLSADVRILRPVDAGAANRRLVLDVVNRGNPVAIRNTDLGPPRRPETESECWLLQQGYTVVSCGWQHNVPGGTERFALKAPEALAHGAQLTGQVRSVVQVNAPTQTVGVADEPSLAEHAAYAVANVNDVSNTLTERDFPLGAPRLIPREEWSFAADGTHVVYPVGFVPGNIYEILYTARGAPLTGVGLAALRDVVSFLRFAPADAGNPCANQLDVALAIGGSQTGRLLRHVLYAGFCVDEADRLVLDGVLTLIAGPIRTEANWRFGQPSFIGSDSPGFAFPFTDAVQTDPVSGKTDGLLRNLQSRPGAQPKVMHLNTSAEYANLNVALIHMRSDGQADADVPDNVRIYHIAGTHHGGGSLPLDNRVFTASAAYYNNSIDYRPLVRCAFYNLAAWVADGVEPPPGRYPRFSDRTLVPRATLEAAAARLPGLGMPPERLYPTQRLDYGPEAASGRAQFPATDCGSYPDWLPAVNGDGNEISGIRLPDIAVPLGTYTGWNPRHPSVGGTQMNLLLNGASIPFPPTASDRQVWHDARASITERYASRDAFLAQVKQAAMDLVEANYLLASDVEHVLVGSSARYDEFSRLRSPLP